ncbi:MAG: ABC transporter ATP-binding protein, partial [Lachnospiraceae bacterium]|nr:ABC transporter ATP-binding protein [Lachnospiraceae bacterium]
MSLIKTVGLTKKRGTQTVLNQVDLSVNEGEFVAIMGKSGAGKSTLLYILGGIETADEGEVVFNGKTLTGLSENALSDIRRKHFGFVFQNYNLIDEMTVEENLLLLKYYDKKLGTDTKEKLVEYAERFDILKCL